MLAPEVVCVGVVTVDALALVDRYPDRDERIESEQVSIVGGGPAANAAVVLARQGVSVAFAGRVGDDAAGEQALHLLELEGVDVSAAIRDPRVSTQSSCVVVSVSAQSRAICTSKVPPWEELSSTAQELIESASWVHGDHLGYAPTQRFLQRLDRRPRFSLDAGNAISDLELGDIDLYVPTMTSLLARYGHCREGDDAAREALGDGALVVVATDGAAGSTAWWGTSGAVIGGAAGPGNVHVPASAGVDIVSTLGAGDVFHGALISAICRRLPWAEALRAANTTAALSCRALDGRSAVPDLAELQTQLDAELSRSTP